jgi:hypothetical protein
MMMDIDQAAKAVRDEEINAEIEDFLEGFNQPTYLGMRINGQRVALPGHPSTVGVCSNAFVALIERRGLAGVSAW